MIEIEGIIFFFDMNSHLRRMVQPLDYHVSVILCLPAFHIILPGHSLRIEAFPRNKEFMMVDKILIDKGIYEIEITEIFSDFEYAILARLCICVVFLSLVCVGNTLKINRIFTLVLHVFNKIIKPHSKSIWVETHSRHGGHPCINTGKIDLMALDSIILEKKDFMPVAGPSFVHDFCAYLGLEKQGCFTYDLKHRQHPFVFFMIKKRGVLH